MQKGDRVRLHEQETGMVAIKTIYTLGMLKRLFPRSLWGPHWKFSQQKKLSSVPHSFSAVYQSMSNFIQLYKNAQAVVYIDFPLITS